MTKLKFLVVLFSLSILSSCDEECDCQIGPFFADLKLNLTINQENPEVEIVIFNGRVENADTAIVDVVSETFVTYELESGRYYSASARYKKGNIEIVAINGKEMKLQENDCGCESPKNHSMNLRLAD